MSFLVQSVMFNKKQYDSKKARSWLKKHDYHPIKRVHKTKNYLRYRIREPHDNSIYRIKKISKNIKFVIEKLSKGKGYNENKEKGKYCRRRSWSGKKKYIWSDYSSKRDPQWNYFFPDGYVYADKNKKQKIRKWTYKEYRKNCRQGKISDLWKKEDEYGISF